MTGKGEKSQMRGKEGWGGCRGASLESADDYRSPSQPRELF